MRLLVAFYVDPGSGSMVLQLLLGGFSGLYVIFRLFKQKILGVFGIRSDDAEPATKANNQHVGKRNKEVQLKRSA